MHEITVLPARIAELAAADEQAPFLHEADSGLSATRGEFDRRARTWSAVFADLGVGAGDTVVTMLPTTIQAAAVWVGLGWLRALEVPVNNDYRGNLLEYIVRDSGARVAVVHASFLDRFHTLREEFPAIRWVVIEDQDAPAPAGSTDLRASDLLAAAQPANLPAPHKHDTAAIIYTSGTTGPSKGVIVPWAQLFTSVVWMPPTDNLAAGGVVYAPFPFYHMSPRAAIYRMALAGGQAVLRRRLSVSNFWSDIRKYGCTYGQLLGSMARMLMQAPPSPQDSENTLQYSTMLPLLSDVDEFEQRFGLRVGTLFTMTETSVPIVTQGVRGADPASCGTIRPGCDVRLVDEFDDEVPVGTVGELIVRTDEPWTLNGGYWGKPAETAAAWRNGWFHTGDAFRKDENGNFYFVDRFKDAIRRRGENISSMEVESLIEGHPAVKEAAAVAVPSPLEEDDLMVYVVLEPGAEIDPAALVADLRELMPAFMVPRFVDYVDELPRTPTQKIRKAQLRARGVTESTFDASVVRAG